MEVLSDYTTDNPKSVEIIDTTELGRFDNVISAEYPLKIKHMAARVLPCTSERNRHAIQEVDRASFRTFEQERKGLTHSK